MRSYLPIIIITELRLFSSTDVYYNLYNVSISAYTCIDSNQSWLAVVHAYEIASYFRLLVFGLPRPYLGKTHRPWFCQHRRSARWGSLTTAGRTVLKAKIFFMNADRRQNLFTLSFCSHNGTIHSFNHCFVLHDSPHAGLLGSYKDG